MNIIKKFFEIIFILFFSNKMNLIINNRIKRCKNVIYSYKEVKFIFQILLLPINAIVNISICFFKIVAIWILPTSIYYNIKYLLKQFYSDVCIKKLGLTIALKRGYLFLKLIILGRERKVSFGSKNKDKIFFVIRPYFYMEKNELATSLSNLLFHYYRNLQHLSYAIENNWIPVIDWENYGPFPHQEDYPINGTTNCWEYYWNQPSEYTLKEVYESKNVILSIRNTREYGFIPSASITSPFKKYVEQLIQKCPKYDSYISTNNFTTKYINKWENELFPKNKKILGVSIRGASYRLKNVPGHPKQPTVEELIRIIQEKFNEWEMDYIFLACEAQDVINEVKEVFAEKLIVLPRLRYTKIPGEIYDGKLYNPLYEDGNKFQSNLDYLTEMVLLSKCNSLIAGMSGGVRMAVIWNAGKYKNIKIFDKGLW